MEIFPAIDLVGGNVVRLTHGDYNRQKTYSENPAQVAEGFIEAGAKNLHVVDLDAAKTGQVTNLPAIRSVVDAGGLYIEVGGGIRDEKRICGYLELGVKRVILGTVAIDDFSFTAAMIRKYGDKIAVGVDAKDGMVAVRGWLDKTQTDAIEFCKKLCDAGVQTIIYTDISRDGAMRGANLELYKTLSDTISCDIMASGGVSTMADVRELKAMGIYGAILGKALYEGALNLREVLELCK
ncbi:MAG: 1-(5-phosphoribosyl)-5-[(5-phosphoribosylamino)methylideneamino]imidazole-4-carboxamide isomerase [Oscillospiraceae bacterium]|nr:1-(5-phosphoribosyl)-5-[(5-phosphoribosylamino)methylideneamino]imidazole-4-carboxamide isomerase [Oscillospiraceae bacterium]